MSYPRNPTADEVIAELGSDIVNNFVNAIDEAREEYESVRQSIPTSIVAFSARTTANVIHDLIWKHLKIRLATNSSVEVIDKEPNQELVISGRFQIRIKRHTDSDRIATYPTDAAMDFWGVSEALPGFERYSLALGYYWDKETRVFGDAVISFRESLNKPIWAIRLRSNSSNVRGFNYEAIRPDLPEVDLTGVAWDAKVESEA